VSCLHAPGVCSPEAASRLPGGDVPLGAVSPGEGVCLLGLKRFASERLPPGSPLREVIICEKDYVTPNAFLAKIGVYLTLIRLEKNYR